MLIKSKNIVFVNYFFARKILKWNNNNNSNKQNNNLSNKKFNK